jgi:hypothetical protein
MTPVTENELRRLHEREPMVRTGADRPLRRRVRAEYGTQRDGVAIANRYVTGRSFLDF